MYQQTIPASQINKGLGIRLLHLVTLLLPENLRAGKVKLSTKEKEANNLKIYQTRFRGYFSITVIHIFPASCFTQFIFIIKISTSFLEQKQKSSSSILFLKWNIPLPRSRKSKTKLSFCQIKCKKQRQK